MSDKDRLPAGKNRLFLEKSPYLLQHADNPVDWRPWGDEAFREARESDRPVFLSVGYATCHWCHVMAHESFEDPGVAEVLNRDFIPVKVDREERPDVDQAYMAACQALTGRGGWPLTVLLTPDRLPFFAGTYFPRQARHGMPGLLDVLEEASRVWDEDRDRITDVARRITEALAPAREKVSGETGPAVIQRALEQLTRSFDPVHGGFGKAPKFPTPPNLVFLLSQGHRHGPGPPGPELRLMAEKTLFSIRNGGIFDQVGFGVHRYSTDEAWLVPHFEKMLYDQALAALAYLSAHAAGLGPGHGETAREIFEYVRRKLTSADGGFFCAEDADTEGGEGSHYVWTPGEIMEVLGAGDGELFGRYFGVTDQGNFEGGKSVLHVPVPLAEFAETHRMDEGDLAARLSGMRLAMLVAREEREKPLLDDKILASWNGLMIAALARGAQVLSDPVLLAGARRAADFVWERMRTPGGLLLHRFRDGEAGIEGFLEDYAFLAWGMIELYEADFDPGHLTRALFLTRTMLDLFLDHADGGLFFSGKGSETPITRTKDLYDGATPSGNSVAAVNLVRLSRLTGETDLEERARDMSRAFGARVAEQPMAYTHFLSAVDLLWGPAAEVVVAGDPGDPRTREMLDVVRKSLRPGTLMLLAAPDHGRLAELAPFVRDMAPGPDGPRAYVCRDRTCQAPVSTAHELERALSE